MARFTKSLLCIVCALVSISTSYPATDRPLGTLDPSSSEAFLSVSRTSPYFTNISLNSPNIVAQDLSIDYSSYQAFGIPGEACVMEDGLPMVPQVSRLYRIPNTGGVSLVIREAEFEIVENVNALPVQVEEGQFGPLHRNEAVYGKDDWFPRDIAAMSEPMIMRDFRVVSVRLYPVQINPVTHQARVYHTLSVDVVSNDDPGVNELTMTRPKSPAFLPIYRSIIANLDEGSLDDSSTTPGSYMILCKDNATGRQWADSLALWKKRCGYDVVLEARTNWTAQTMISFIRNAYSNGTVPLEFVCLVGDPAAPFGIPSDATNDWSDGNFDHSFALGNVGDDLEDIGVGRLVGINATEMATINAKIMSYERNPWMQTNAGVADTNWFHKGFFYCGAANNSENNWMLMQWGARQFANFTGVTDTAMVYTMQSVDNQTVWSHINGGVSYFIWRGSIAGEMNNVAATGCAASWRLPVTITITCGTGAFIDQGGHPGVAEAWLVSGSPTQPRGGVSAIGSASSTHTPQNICLVGGFMHSIANAGVEHVGTALNAAKAWLIATTFIDGSEGYFCRINNLFGDPGMSMWTDVPKRLNVLYPTTLAVGERSAQISVHRDADNDPVKDAMVVLWKGTETYSRALTDAQGNATLPITINSPGDLLLTITKRNHKPFLATVPCVSVTQMVSISSYLLDDDNAGGTVGNGNNMMNPGETIDLPIYLKNFGTTAGGTGISAILTSSNPRVTVVSSTATFPDLAAGDSAVCSTPYRISVSPEMGHDENVLLSLSITASNIQTISVIDLVCHAGRITYISNNLSAVLNPGDTRNLSVTIKNTGTQEMTGVTGHLVSMSPFIFVNTSDAPFGTIPINGQVNNSNARFTLTANTLTFRGHIVPLLLIATTTTGYIDTTQFTISVGTATSTDPTGPDGFGYYAYDNVDVSYEAHPTFNYVNISVAGMGTNLAINDPGEKPDNDPFPRYSTVRALPFHFKYYGVIYDTVTICSNGWIAFGNQAYHDGWQDYPIPAQQAPNAMIAPYWDDLQTTGSMGGSPRGVWAYSDTANHRYIVQWRATGATHTTAALDFEVILYDTVANPTLTGNGEILFQYSQVQMNLEGHVWEGGSSIGIQDYRGTTGLPLAHQSSYSPGTASIVNGRAILLTTNARALFGTLQGHITNAETDLPISGVSVALDGYNYSATTDVAGFYQIHNVLIGTYTARSTRHGFNDGVSENVLIELDSTRIVDFSLLHPEIGLSTDSIHLTVPTQPSQTSFSIGNGGNGPLDYSIGVAYAPSSQIETAWDELATINVSQLTNDLLILGCEFAGDYWWVSGGSGPNGNNMIYKFDINGNYAGSLLQSTTTSFGWYDLAYDGTNLYGSEDQYITGFNVQTGVPSEPIPSPLYPSRAIAYDVQSGHFWVADYTSNIFEIDRQGTVLQEVVNEGVNELSITGLAWNAQESNGYKLYIFSQNGANSFTTISRMHPISKDIQTVIHLSGQPGERAGGCTITTGWNSTLLVFAGILQNGTGGDRLGVYEMNFNTTWITINPSQGSIPGAGSGDISIVFHQDQLRANFIYRVSLLIHSQTLDSTIVLPVALTVLPVAVTDPNVSGLPTEYALHQNYPNPFNPATEIRYDLKAAGQTKLTVYNLMGQTVATIVDEFQPAGVYTCRFDGTSLGSGVYFFRLECNDFVQSAKMILLK